MLLKQYVNSYFARNASANVKLLEIEVQPACLALQRFREKEVNLSSNKDDVYASLEFLQFASKQSTNGKEIEMIVMIFLIWYDEENDGSDNAELSIKRNMIKDWFRKLESVALWILVAKPSCKERHRRCFSVLQRTFEVKEDLQRSTKITFLTKQQKTGNIP